MTFAIPVLTCSDDSTTEATLTWDYSTNLGTLTVGCQKIPFSATRDINGTVEYGFPSEDNDDVNVVEWESVEVWSNSAGSAVLPKDAIAQAIEANRPKLSLVQEPSPPKPLLPDGLYILHAAICKLVDGVWEIPAREFEGGYVAPVPYGTKLEEYGSYGPKNFTLYPDWPLVFLNQSSYRIVP